MKKIIIAIVILAGLFAIFSGVLKENGQVFDSAVMPLSFKYPEGYHMEERATTITIMREEDYQSILRGEREGGEGPPVISISLYDNPSNPSPRSWTEQYPQLSNYSLRTSEISETTLAGFPAVTYTADGLYPSRNIVGSDDIRIYHVSGQYLEQDSPIYRDFEPLVNSIEFK
jgi:hypothetical protein